MTNDKLQISLAAARVNAGLTQGEAASKMNIAKSTIVNWEKGRTELSIQDAQRLCKLYKISIDNIFLPSSSNDI